MSEYVSIDDPEFAGESLSLRESYLTMVKFLEAYHQRGESSTGALLGDIQIGLWSDKSSADPAQLYDYLEAFRKVQKQKEEDGHSSQEIHGTQ